MLIFVVAFLAFFQCLNAEKYRGLNANNDHGLWLDQNIFFPVEDQLQARLQLQQRWGDDYRTNYFDRVAINIDFNIKPYLWDENILTAMVGPGFASTRELRKNTEGNYEWIWQERYSFEANFNVLHRCWQISHRGMIDYIHFSQNDHKPYWQYRHRIEFRPPLIYTIYELKPYLSNEWFFRKNTYRRNKPGTIVGNWYQNRLRVGFEFPLFKAKLNNQLSAQAYFQWRVFKQSPGTRPLWYNNWMIGLSINYNL